MAAWTVTSGLASSKRSSCSGGYSRVLQYRPAHRADQHHAADVERQAHAGRDLARGRGVRNTQLRQDLRQQVGDHRAGADEETLHRIAARALLGRQLVADEGAERFHRHVDRCIQQPQHDRREPQHRRVRHHEQRQRGQDGADQEVGATATQPGPGAVGVVADDRLHQQAGHRRGDPEDGQVVHLRAQGLEDAAHAAVLQGEGELDAEETEAHVPDLPERKLRFPARAGCVRAGCVRAACSHSACSPVALGDDHGHVAGNASGNHAALRDIPRLRVFMRDARRACTRCDGNTLETRLFSSVPPEHGRSGGRCGKRGGDSRRIRIHRQHANRANAADGAAWNSVAHCAQPDGCAMHGVRGRGWRRIVGGVAG